MDYKPLYIGLLMSPQKITFKQRITSNLSKPALGPSQSGSRPGFFNPQLTSVPLGQLIYLQLHFLDH
jgi:hypothetical protein